MATVGAFLLLNHAGQVLIERGMVKPQDKATAQRNGIEGVAAFTSAKKVKSVRSVNLCRRLTGHCTTAVQVKLAANPNVALGRTSRTP